MVGPIRAILESTYRSFDTTINNALAFLTGNQDGTSGAAAGTLSLGNININELKNTVLEATKVVLDPVCNVILAICMLIALADVAMRVDMLKWEHGLKIAVKLVFAKLCIDVAPSFMWACYQQCATWIQDFAETLGSDTSSLGNLMADNMDSFERIGVLNAIVLAGVCLVAFIGIKICGLLVAVIAFARIFEILVYVAVSPIPCAFFPLGEGPGMAVSRITKNFFKNYIAVCLQGVLMAICLCVFNRVAAGLVQNLFPREELLEEAAEAAEETRGFWQIVWATIFQPIVDAVTGLTADNSAEVIANTFNMSFTMLMLVVALIIILLRCNSWAKSIMDAH